MFRIDRFLTIFVCIVATLYGLSVVAFYYPPAAHLCALNLSHAKLGGANLARADLRWVNLSDAVLDGTDLRGADLRYAVGLTREQLMLAHVDEQTILPDYLRRPAAFRDTSALKLDPAVVKIPFKFPLNKVALAPDNSAAAVVGETDEVKLWRTGEDTGIEELRPLKGLGGNGRSVCFHPRDGQTVAVGSDDGAIRIWKIGDRRPFRILKNMEYEGYVFNLKYDPSGQSLVSASQNENEQKTVHFWTVDKSTPDSTVKVGRAERIVDLSPEGLMAVVSTSSPLRVELRPIRDYGSIRELAGASGQATAGALSPDGRFVAVSTRLNDGEFPEGSIFLWRVSDSHLLPAPPNVMTAYVVSLDFSPDGQLLAAGWSDGSISLWDVGRGRRLIAFFGHTGEVSNIAFGADKGLFASVGTDKLVRLWQIKER